MRQTPHDRITTPWLLLLAAWTVPALLSTFETIAFSRLGPNPIEVWRAFASEAPGWYAWAAFTKLIVLLAHRFPLQRPLRVRAVVIHVGAFLLVASTASAVWAAVGMWLRPTPRSFGMMWWGWFLTGLPFTVLVYAAVVGIAYTVSHRARLREQERHAETMARALAEAQLATLRMQLRPHFLFNTLNAVMALVRDNDGERAISAVAMLSDLLRSTLRLGAVAEVPLGEEIAFTRRYLAIEQLRFGQRLRVSIDVPADTIDLAVPTFVLQPFVENAVRHGILPRPTGGTVTITARRLDGDVVLTVQDDGVGLPAQTPSAPAGVGVPNARRTLQQLYGTRAELQLAEAPGGGAAVTIRLPARAAARTDVIESAVA